MSTTIVTGIMDGQLEMDGQPEMDIIAIIYGYHS